MSGLSIIEDSPSKLHLKQNYWVGWLFAVMGLGLLYFPEWKTELKSQDNFWLVYAVGGLFILAGFASALYRLEIQFDLIQGRFDLTKGFWPHPKKTRGSLSDIEHILLSKKWRSSGGKNNSQKRLHWQLGFKFADQDRPIIFYDSQNEKRTREEFEKRSKQLKIRGLDATGEEALIIEWDRHDQSVIERNSPTSLNKVDLAAPPQGLSYRAVSNGVIYWTQKPGLNKATVFGGLFGLIFFTPGLFLVCILVGLPEALGVQSEVSGSPMLGLMLGSIFTLMGGTIIKFSIDHAFTQFRFGFSAEEFVYTTVQYQRESSLQRFPLLAIEDFGLRENTSSRNQSQVKIGNVSVRKTKRSKKPELFVRTDDEILKIKSLTPEQSLFLKNAFYQMIDKKLDDHEQLAG